MENRRDLIMRQTTIIRQTCKDIETGPIVLRIPESKPRALLNALLSFVEGISGASSSVGGMVGAIDSPIGPPRDPCM